MKEGWDLLDHVHPELKDALLARTELLITADTIDMGRTAYKQAMEQKIEHTPKNNRIKKEVRTIPGMLGNPEVTVYIYKPVDAPLGMPVFISMHGGGLIVGNAVNEEFNNILFTEQLNCMVISPEYRLAPEYPFPAGLNDCYATLLWLAENPESLGIDPSKICVGGYSAGGCLAAAVSIKALQENGPKIWAQFLIYPMLDCRNLTCSSKEIIDGRVWSRQQNIIAWEMYLGKPIDDEESPLASPALLNNHTDLPPAFIMVGTLDVFRDECIRYANDLLAAGVDVELHVFSGVYHAADVFVQTAKIAQRMKKTQLSAMTNFFANGYF